MRNLKFHYARARDIFCFGPVGVEFHFDDYNNIVQITGLNLDNPGTTEEDRSNGSGKSSIPEIISVALFGKTIKYPKKLKGADILNTIADKGEVELIWDDYRVVRTYQKTSGGTISSKIKIWESSDHIWDKDSDVTQGTSAACQTWIDERIGLSHRAFCSVAIFEDSDRNSFLEMDASEKREFIENLLGIDVFREYHENAKGFLKEQRKLVEKLVLVYERLQQDLSAIKTRSSNTFKQAEDWKKEKEDLVAALLKKAVAKETELQSTSTGVELVKWQAAQDEIETLNGKINEYEMKRDKFKEVVGSAREKLELARENKDLFNHKIQNIKLSLNKHKSGIEEQIRLSQRLENLEDGAECPTCHGVINQMNYGDVLHHSREEIDNIRSRVHKENIELKELENEFDVKVKGVANLELKIKEADEKLLVLERGITKNRSEIAVLSKVAKPDGSNAGERVLEAEITGLRKRINDERESLKHSPYKEIIEEIEKEQIAKTEEMEEKSLALEAAEHDIPYYEYWVKAFGDNGIRRYVIEGIIPALNARIAYWMEYLIDNKLHLTFNSKLEDTITRSGYPVRYYAMCKSERRRINLGVSQAFAYVMMINSGTCPSLVFLDEITGGSIDRAGIAGIFNMISELSKERQVFITTHDENLISMLSECQTIKLKKENDITILDS